MASVQFEVLKERWNTGRISESMLANYVKVGRITAEEFTKITGLSYSN